MRNQITITILKFITLGLIGHTSFAFTSQQITEPVFSFQSPRSVQEICHPLNKLIPSAYSEDDLESEQKLCSIDFYKSYGLCPKQNSTNPGVLVTEIPEGAHRDQVIEACAKDQDVKVVAKFKNSITCSYTPSILAYYHFSKIFDAGRVPQAVLRTMDLSEHLNQAHLALQLMPKLIGEPIYTSWQNFINQDNRAINPLLYDTQKSIVYGALSENPKHEEKYTEVSGVGNYETRYERFQKQLPFLRTTDARSIDEIAASTDLKKIIPLAVQMKDVTQMIFLDTLFNQDDRIGNIHFKFKWYFIKTDDDGEVSIKEKKSKAGYDRKKAIIIPDEELQYPEKGGFLVKEMLMKDNDCGINTKIRQNNMKRIKAIEQIRHFSKKTYQNILKFHKIARSTETIMWMKKELLMTDSDIGLDQHPLGFLNNLDYIVRVLKTNCQNQTLKLDLDIKDVLNHRLSNTADCELAE